MYLFLFICSCVCFFLLFISFFLVWLFLHAKYISI